ncbi:hypothetical protein P8625_06815 [Tenacibaculum tangerinum]|uniref:Bacteriocin n=1 Tax=Tenacibaculum tangerinum TaxID=3038772 RepID=A0ABY8L8C1_9FLAO|nr:hypothetical protein [Tenacibaculum tangerinum]WGH76847.1 hypothetical protein P8625_06815 [Tenacibaculum tangerinum]
MKKQILNLGNALNKAEQTQINGGLKLKPTLCCDPALRCCTTSHLAQNNASCGGTYISGCQYHPATECCI